MSNSTNKNIPSDTIPTLSNMTRTPMLARAGLLLAAGALVTACSQTPSIQTGSDADTMMGGTLNKVDNTAVDVAYVDPTGDYDRYTKVWIPALDLDNVEIIQPQNNASIVNRYNREWELTDEDKTKLQDAFAEAMTNELTDKGEFAIADGPGDDVLKIEAMITMIAPSGPKDDMTMSTTRSRVFTEGAGGMSIAIMLADGDSGEVLAIIKDTRNSNNSNWGLNNSVSNLADVRRNFSTWASQIHRGLTGLKTLAASK